MNGCAGCGKALEPNKGPGRARKWCSGRCRKASYGDPCIDCGARTCYGAESARVAEPRCAACNFRHESDRRCERVLQMMALRYEGLTNQQISDVTGIPRNTVSVELYRLRLIGFDVPAADYNNAKLAQSREYSPREAHVLGRELAKRGHVPAEERQAA